MMVVVGGSGSWNMLLKINFHRRTIRLLRSGMTDWGLCICVAECTCTYCKLPNKFQTLELVFIPKRDI